MSHNRSVQQSLENTIGDGNCAFNAFILALADKEILDKIDAALCQDKALENRLDTVAKRAKFKDWRTFREALLTKDRIQLQNELSPLFRQIAIEQIENRMDEYLTATTVDLQSLLDKLITNKIELTVIKDKMLEYRDDTYCHHDFITNKFKQLLKENRDSNAAADNLKNWWREQGLKKFLNTLKNPSQGEVKRYGGDAELAALGDFFNIQVNVTAEGRTQNQSLHFNYGPQSQDELTVFVETVGEATLNTLRKNQIITGNTGGHYKWAKNFSKEVLCNEVKKVLSPEKNEILGCSPQEKILEIWEKDHVSPSANITLKHSGNHWEACHSLPIKLDHVAQQNGSSHHILTALEKENIYKEYKETVQKTKGLTFENAQTEWEAAIIQAKNDKEDDVKEGIDYTIEDGKTIKVSKNKQQDLDKKYARKLQQEELDEWKKEQKKSSKP